MMAAGNVHISYCDYVADGPKAVMHLNPNTNKPQKIIFMGRSKIVEKGVNSVEADRITMTVEPKTFKAEGNVKSSIEQNSKSKYENEMEFKL